MSVSMDLWWKPLFSFVAAGAAATEVATAFRQVVKEYDLLGTDSENTQGCLDVVLIKASTTVSWYR